MSDRRFVLPGGVPDLGAPRVGVVILPAQLLADLLVHQPTQAQPAAFYCVQGVPDGAVLRAVEPLGNGAVMLTYHHPSFPLPVLGAPPYQIPWNITRLSLTPPTPTHGALMQ